MKRFLLLLFTFCSLFQSRAQLIEHEWTRSFNTGGGPYSFTSGMSINDIGYVYSVHSFRSYSWAEYYSSNFYSNGDQDIMIVKTSSTRNAMWSRHIGGSGLDHPTAIEQLSNGDLIISGIFSDSVDFDPGIDTVWKVSQGQTDNFLLKLDKDGNFINCITFGGSGTSYVNDLQITENDEVFICGWYTDSLNFSPLPQQNIHVCSEGYSSYLSKFESNLNYISSVAFEGNISIYDLDLTDEQTILYSGGFEDTAHTYFDNIIEEKHSAGFRDVIFGEVDYQLNSIFQKRIGSSEDEVGWHIGQLSNGTTVLQLNFENFIEIVNGAETIHIEGLQPGQTSLSPAMLKNTLLLCLSNDDVVWYKTFSGIGTNAYVYPVSDFVCDEDGNLIASYYFYVKCDLGEENFNLVDDTAPGGSFILKISQNGDMRWVRRLNAHGSGRAIVYALKLKEDNLYGAGKFTGTIDFDLSVSTSTYYASSDPFLAKWTLHDQHLSTNTNSGILDPILYPNPTKEILFLKELDIRNLSIFDLSGREINPDYYFNGNHYEINTAKLKNGAYLLNYEKGNELITQRFVVQH